MNDMASGNIQSLLQIKKKRSTLGRTFIEKHMIHARKRYVSNETELDSSVRNNHGTNDETNSCNHPLSTLSCLSVSAEVALTSEDWTPQQNQCLSTEPFLHSPQLANNQLKNIEPDFTTMHFTHSY